MTEFERDVLEEQKAKIRRLRKFCLFLVFCILLVAGVSYNSHKEVRKLNEEELNKVQLQLANAKGEIEILSLDVKKADTVIGYLSVELDRTTTKLINCKYEGKKNGRTK